MSTRGDIEKAAQSLRAKQQEYYVQWVKDAIDTEKQRKAKLARATSKDECKRLEKQFERERIKDKERMQQIQEDHQLILRAKMAEWRTHGVPESVLAGSQPTSSGAHGEEVVASSPSTDQIRQKGSTAKISKATLERLSTPTANASLTLDVSQDDAFQKDAIRRQDKLRLYRNHAAHAPQRESLKTLSETDLLSRKMNLLNQLHSIVSLQGRIIQDDQCTVRSSVSSWKSADIQSVKGSSR